MLFLTFNYSTAYAALCTQRDARRKQNRVLDGLPFNYFRQLRVITTSRLRVEWHALFY